MSIIIAHKETLSQKEANIIWIEMRRLQDLITQIKKIIKKLKVVVDIIPLLVGVALNRIRMEAQLSLQLKSLKLWLLGILKIQIKRLLKSHIPLDSIRELNLWVVDWLLNLIKGIEGHVKIEIRRELWRNLLNIKIHLLEFTQAQNRIHHRLSRLLKINKKLIKNRGQILCWWGIKILSLNMMINCKLIHRILLNRILDKPLEMA